MVECGPEMMVAGPEVMVVGSEMMVVDSQYQFEIVVPEIQLEFQQQQKIQLHSSVQGARVEYYPENNPKVISKDYTKLDLNLGP